MTHNSPKIVFFGTPSFAHRILEALVEAGYMPVAVVTSPSKQKGRGLVVTDPPVKTYAKKEGIPVLQPEKLKDEKFLEELRILRPDIFIVASYGKILPAVLLAIPAHGTSNVHPSLLPKHRGPSPIQTTILAGEKQTGVTIILLDAEMDHGPILSQKELEFPISNFQFQKLHDILANLGGKLLIETIPKWIAGIITPQEQDHEKATYTKLLTKEDGRIDWLKSAEEIDCMVRALNPWPSTWSLLKIPEAKLPESHMGGKRIKILAGYPTDEPSPAPPGTLVKTKNGQLAACTSNNLYVVETLQLEGRHPVKSFNLKNLEDCFLS